MSTTESTSHFSNLESMRVRELLTAINSEDQTVASSVALAIPSIEILTTVIAEKMKTGGRLFYIGAGTSGRLGVVDASEIPPTYGLSQGHVIGIIAGGDTAIRQSVEHAEDDEEQAWKDLVGYNISRKDVLVGIAASGRTPYVIGGIRKARSEGIVTGCIVCNENSVLARESEYPVEVVVGPEFVTGSTRMKSGTAQKLVLNMISTTVMIQLGRVKGNKMVDMQMTNNKLIARGVQMIMDELAVSAEQAEKLLKKYGSVRAAVDKGK